jgi:hypothetical protein
MTAFDRSRRRLLATSTSGPYEEGSLTNSPMSSAEVRVDTELDEL